MANSWIDKKNFWKFDWKTSIWDMPFLLAPVIFSHYFINEQNLFDVISHTQLALIMQFTVFALPWYIGYIYVRYDFYYAKFIIGILGLGLFYFLFELFGITFFASLPLMSDERTSVCNVVLIVLSLGNIIFIPAAFYGGQLTGKKAFFDEYAEDEKYYARWFAFGLVLVAWVIAGFYASWLNESNAFVVWTYVIFCIVVPIVAAVYFVKLLRVIKRVLENAGVYKKILGVVHVVLPVFIALALIIFGQVAQRSVHVFEVADVSYSPSSKIMWLIVLGVIPFRIFLMFNPPLRGISLIISAVTLTFYIWGFSHNTYNPLTEVQQNVVNVDSARTNTVDPDSVANYREHEEKR